MADNDMIDDPGSLASETGASETVMGARDALRAIMMADGDGMGTLLESAGLDAKTDLNGADLSGVDLAGEDLTGADLRDTDLRDADLHGARLAGASLACADAEGADLSSADLRGASLRGANLRNAVLTGAQVRNADFTDADLTGADLTGVDLETEGPPVSPPEFEGDPEAEKEDPKPNAALLRFPGEEVPKLLLGLLWRLADMGRGDTEMYEYIDEVAADPALRQELNMTRNRLRNRKRRKRDEELAFAAATRDMGLVQWRLGDPQGALTLYEEAGRVWEKLDEKRLLAEAALAKGCLHVQLGQRPQAIRHLGIVKRGGPSLGPRVALARAILGLEDNETMAVREALNNVRPPPTLLFAEEMKLAADLLRAVLAQRGDLDPDPESLLAAVPSGAAARHPYRSFLGAMRRRVVQKGIAAAEAAKEAAARPASRSASGRGGEGPPVNRAVQMFLDKVANAPEPEPDPTPSPTAKRRIETLEEILAKREEAAAKQPPNPRAAPEPAPKPQEKPERPRDPVASAPAAAAPSPTPPVRRRPPPPSARGPSIHGPSIHGPSIHGAESDQMVDELQALAARLKAIREG